MPDELFPEAEVAMLSPKLRWMQAHNAVTYRSTLHPVTWYAGFADGPVTEAAAWFCEETGKNGDSRCGLGDTEDEALADLARKYAVKHWTGE